MDGMFLSAGLNNWFRHIKFEGKDFWSEPVSITINSWIGTFNYSFGFEIALGHKTEVFTELFYEKNFSADSDSDNFHLNQHYLDILGLSLGFYLRGS